jgi:hypothetical protein
MKKVINNEQIFTESKLLREEYIERYDILDKLKAILYLTNDMVVNVEMVANYYEVTNKAINTIIDRHREELEEDGIMVLRGEDLKEFKSNIWYPQSEDTKKYDVSIDYSKINKTTVTTILTRRAMLRIGMLLTTSSVAVKVRNYLLNLEENSTDEQKRLAIQREAGKIERKRMTTAIQDYIPNSPNKKFAYPNYTNMIYRIIFGKDAKEIRLERGITKDSELTRDKFSEYELKTIAECETIVSALVTLSFSYDYIKEQLEKKYKKLIG